MLLFYGWVAGIMVGRVATFGSTYINQPRYVIRFAVQLIALLLMWTEPSSEGPPLSSGRLLRRAAVVGVCLLIAFQVKLAKDTWHYRRSYIAHYAEVARQTGKFVSDPTHFS